MECVITLHTNSAAIRAKNLLSLRGIPAKAVRLNAAKSAKGCGWGLLVSCRDSDSCALLLTREKIAFSGILPKEEAL